MEKIIKGKIYNTDKSEIVTQCSTHNIKVNFDDLNEILFKTKNGEYFLYSYVCNIISGSDKLLEDLNIVDIFEIMKWYEKRQTNFSEEEKKKFFKEFRRFFVEA